MTIAARPADRAARAPITTRPSPTALLTWHRPLMVLAALMVLCAVVSAGGLLLDDREFLGQPIWAKSLKFALSIGIYAVTWAWLIGQLTRFRRTAWWLGTVSAAMLGIEQVIITAAVVRGTGSHFNVTTGLNGALYSVMGLSVVAVWVATLVVTLLLFATPGADHARDLAIRWGAGLAVVGMAVAFLMTIPTAAQIDAPDGIIGAHAVGVADGGPGLPFLGWSTTGGDLRIPHFVGMHALQLIPLFLIAVELLARRFGSLRAVRVRARLVTVAGAGYAAVIVLLTWQALRGQSIVHPDMVTGTAGALLVAGLIGGTLGALRGGGETRAAEPRAEVRSPTPVRPADVADPRRESGVTRRTHRSV